MSIEGIDRITYGVEDLDGCKRFFLDWGLTLVREDASGLNFESLNGCELFVRKADDAALPPAVEAGSTVREVIWGVASKADLAALGAVPKIDPNGIGLGFRVTRKRPVDVAGTPANVWGHAARIDTPSPVYDRAQPVEVGHVVFFTDKLAEMTAFYEKLGFCVSDRYPGRGVFLRCAARGHHDLFLLQLPDGKRGLNHVAFAVRDLHEVIGGGLAMARHGWETQIGPGRHPISSALFWYFKSPAGGLVEYYADEDVLTEHWTPRDFTPSPEMFAEWAVVGGIDGNTRRQKQGRMTARLEFRDVTKRFANPRQGGVIVAVEGVTLSIADGEVVSLIGPSGCGKSTLLNMGAGLDPASSGEVYVDGEKVTRPNRHVAFMLQKDLLLPWRTIVENVELGQEIQNVPARERRQRALDLLAKCRLGDFVDHYPHQLSGGMRQRALARTLAVDPSVLLMDEPFSALDAQTKMVLQQDLGRTLADTGKTALFITHDLMEAVALSDRVLVMSQRPGRIIEEIVVEVADRDNPMKRRQHPRIAEYVVRLMGLLQIEQAAA